MDAFLNSFWKDYLLHLRPCHTNAIRLEKHKNFRNKSHRVTFYASSACTASFSCLLQLAIWLDSLVSCNILIISSFFSLINLYYLFVCCLYSAIILISFSLFVILKCSTAAFKKLLFYLPSQRGNNSEIFFCTCVGYRFFCHAMFY